MKNETTMSFEQVLVVIFFLAIALFFATKKQTCLPDSPDRFYMGHGTNGSCLYQDMNTGEIYND